MKYYFEVTKKDLMYLRRLTMISVVFLIGLLIFALIIWFADLN